MFGFSTLQAMGLSALLALAAVTYPAIQIHNWRVDNLQAAWAEKREQAVEAAKAASQKACDDNNRITKEQSHALQARLDATAARYYSLLKHTTTGGGCAVTIASAARGGDEAASAAVPVMLLPVAAAKEADDQASRLIVLQDTVAEIYRQNGQAGLLPDEHR